jgi:hypothetical protein
MLCSHTVQAVTIFSTSGNTPAYIYHIFKLIMQCDAGAIQNNKGWAGICLLSLYCLPDLSHSGTIGLYLERLGSEMNYDDQWIYYTSLDDNSSLYRIKADGTGRLKLVNGLSGLIHTGDGWVFFFAQAKLFMIKPDGTGMTQVR